MGEDHGGAVLAVNTETPRVLLKDPKMAIHIIPEKMIKKKEHRKSVVAQSTMFNSNNLTINVQ
jgi:hypothetical protein